MTDVSMEEYCAKLNEWLISLREKPLDFSCFFEKKKKNEEEESWRHRSSRMWRLDPNERAELERQAKKERDTRWNDVSKQSRGRPMFKPDKINYSHPRETTGVRRNISWTEMHNQARVLPVETQPSQGVSDVFSK